MNVQLCFPHYDKDQRRTLVRASIDHTCCAFLELAVLWYRPVDQVMKLISAQDLDPAFQQDDHGKIIIAPHHGSWELLGLWMGSNHRLISLYKPSKSTLLDRFLIDKRGRSGAQLAPTNTAGLRQLLQGLKNGANVIILPDQRPAAGTARVDAPFFGHPAPTSLLVRNLAARVDCNIYIAAASRDLNTASYHLTIKKLDREEFLRGDMESAVYLNESIEAFINGNLEQYQWPYRRYERSTYR